MELTKITKKHIFVAIVGRTSVKKGTTDEKTVCLVDVCQNGDLIKDHAWVSKRENFRGIYKDDIITFEAKIVPYLSMDKDGRKTTKYRFSKLTNVKRLGKVTNAKLSESKRRKGLVR